ncbi:MAG: hypothetical protein U1F07_05505 [Rubrivivax sp.]
MVGNLVSWEGNQAYKYTATTTGTNTVAGATTSINTVSDSYSRRTATAEVTMFGTEVTTTQSVSGFNVATVNKMVWSPPLVDRRYTMAIGDTLTQSYAGTNTTTTAGILGAPGTSSTVQVSVTNVSKFVGIESVTVPAGTFNACKFQEWAAATPDDVSTSWLVVGKGVSVKTVSASSSGTQTIQARSVKINGQSL